MPSSPRSEVLRVNDPLRTFRGRAAFSNPGAGHEYVGRVVVEVWNINGAPANRSEGIIVSVDPGTGHSETAILERLAAVLPKHLAQLATDYKSNRK